MNSPIVIRGTGAAGKRGESFTSTGLYFTNVVQGLKVFAAVRP